ncbi:MAG TPA: amidohydrolase family protein [Candidatus Melainabacteria bacterium]|nr:amidohydrolase family protein [Candidatus Melainabacteria bacterium]
MKKLRLVGGQVITPLEVRFADILIEGGLIKALVPPEQATPAFDNLEIHGRLVTPGLIDLQLNGGPALDFWGKPQEKDLQKFTRDQAAGGVTTFLPTLITAPIEHLVENIEWLNKHGVSPDLALARGLSARMPGIHLEGPCLSHKRPGVHPKECLQPFNVDVLKRLIMPGVLLMTVAPELDPGGDALKYLQSKGVKASLGHSDANLEEARRAFDAGIRMLTHTFNAMAPLHHREPGAAGAAFLDERVTCCLIADGLHLAPETVSLILRLKGPGKSILVTDAARIGTTGGGLVGSSIHLADAVRNCVSWQSASFQNAVRMASYNPARAMGLEEKVGHIEVGKYADLVVWNPGDLTVEKVLIDGQVLSAG